jgi:hypothetical protein
MFCCEMRRKVASRSLFAYSYDSLRCFIAILEK